MEILIWEIDYLLSGKDKDIIISQHVINQRINQMLFKILIIQMILKVYGHMFIIHIVLKLKKPLHSLNMEIKNQDLYYIQYNTQLLKKLNSF